MLTEEFSRSIDQEQEGLLRITKFMVELVGPTCVFENGPSTWLILLDQADLVEQFKLLSSKFVVAALVILVFGLRDIELHESVLIQVLLPLISCPLIERLAW